MGFAIRQIFPFNLNYIKRLAIDCVCPEALLIFVQVANKQRIIYFVSDFLEYCQFMSRKYAIVSLKRLISFN